MVKFRKMLPGDRRVFEQQISLDVDDKMYATAKAGGADLGDLVVMAVLSITVDHENKVVDVSISDVRHGTAYDVPAWHDRKR